MNVILHIDKVIIICVKTCKKYNTLALSPSSFRHLLLIQLMLDESIIQEEEMIQQRLSLFHLLFPCILSIVLKRWAYRTLQFPIQQAIFVSLFSVMFLSFPFLFSFLSFYLIVRAHNYFISAAYNSSNWQFQLQYQQIIFNNSLQFMVVINDIIIPQNIGCRSERPWKSDAMLKPSRDT